MKYLGVVIILLIVIFGVSINIISLAQGTDWIQVLSKILIHIGEGIGKVVFTPNLLWILLALFVFISSERFIILTKKFSEVFEQFGSVRFRNPSGPEQPIKPEDITDRISSSPSGGKTDRTDVDFYKYLFTKNGAMVITRFLIYAIDKPGRPSDFSVQQLVDWTFGTEARHVLESESMLHSINYPASLLIQTGALEGSYRINPDGTGIFESTRVTPAAHQAIEELIREGYQMTPQVVL